MNTFGRNFRISIFGESHGERVGVVIDGCPPGISVEENDFIPDLMRRRSGNKGTTDRKEADFPLFRSGIFNGKTTGTPILIVFENKDISSVDYERIKDTPRPGHADMVAWQKFKDFHDYRGGGHFSGRLTVALVAAGVIARKILKTVKINATVLEIGGSKDFDGVLEKAIAEGDSLGGIIECIVTELPPGLGEPFFDSMESVLSHIIFSIPGIKAIEFGSGFNCSKMSGSEYNDEIINIEGKTKTNHSGGINGGISNGNDIIFRVAVRPTASIKKPLMTVDLTTGEPAEIIAGGRHDACIALRMPVIVEAVTAIVLADFMASS
ncbi:MAG: chorismate synthase [Candidatus Eremiobacterota bacterium]